MSQPSCACKKRLLIPGIIAAIIICAFVALKIYEHILANRIKEAIVSQYPQVQTDVSVSILGSKVTFSNTTFQLTNLMPGFSPKYLIKEGVFEDVNVFDVARGQVDMLGKMYARGVEITTPLFTGLVDEIGLSGMSGDMTTIAALWVNGDYSSSAEQLLTAMQSLHIDTYYIKNYVIKTKGFMRQDVVLGDLLFTDLSLSHVGPSHVKKVSITDGGSQLFRLDSLEVAGFDLPGGPALALAVVQEMLGRLPAPPSTPVNTNFAVTGLTLKGFYKEGLVDLEQASMDLDKKDGVYSIQSSAQGLNLTAELLAMAMSSPGLVSVHPQPFTLAMQADVRFTETSGPNAMYPYALDIKDFRLEEKDLFRLFGSGVGALSANLNDALVYKGSLSLENRSLVDTILQAVALDNGSTYTLLRNNLVQSLNEAKAQIKDPASKQFAGNVESFLGQPGTLDVSFSTKAGVSAHILPLLLQSNGQNVGLSTSFTPAR